MEKEESKKVCCGEVKSSCCGENEKCGHEITNCCKNWKKCCLLKIMALVVVIIIVFCLGSQWGEMKGEYRNNRFERGGRMMNWNDERFERSTGNEEVVTDEATIKVEGEPAAPIKQ